MRTTPNDFHFQTVANTIQGTWYNFSTDEILILSPADTPMDVCDMVVIRNGASYSDYYLLGVHSNHEIYMLMGDQKGIEKATIKVITNDTLILQKPDCNMIIYERRQDTSFADNIIAAL
jgi:hypothetical protein